MSDVAFNIVDARSRPAIEAMTAYFDELDGIFDGGFDPGDTLVADAGSFDPPDGAFVIAHIDDVVAGCGGVLRLGPGTAEIKRMWVDPECRGRGVARQILGELERLAIEIGASTVRLDTNASLHGAIAMYEAAGYRSIDRYNENPYAQRWFEKTLG